MFYDPVEAIQDADALFEEQAEDMAALRHQITILSSFLQANFGNEIGLTNDPHGESAVEMAVRLLNELIQRRRQVKAISADLVEKREMLRGLEYLCP